MEPTSFAQFNFRLPKALHKLLKRAATRRHRSDNAQTLAYVEEGLIRDGLLAPPPAPTPEVLG